MRREDGIAIGCGSIAGISQALSAFSILPLMISFLVLYGLGLSLGRRALILASGTSMAVLILSYSIFEALSYLVIYHLPIFYYCYYALLYRDSEDGQREWYPIVRILCGLTLFVIVVGVVSVAGQAGQETPLYEEAIKGLSSELTSSGTDPDVSREIAQMLSAKPYIFFSLNAWVAILIHLAAAAIAQVILRRLQISVRPSMALGYTPLPNWLLALAVGAAVVGLFTTGNVQFLGMTVAFTTLLPYAINMLCLLHHYARNWQLKGLWLFFIYASLAFYWPIVVLACWGMVDHCLQLRKLL